MSIDMLEDLIRDGSKQLRPILTNLNDDNAWLLSCPRPPAERAASGKTYYHVALDPWLTSDGAVMFGAWFFSMKRDSEASAPNAAALGALADRIEAIASKQVPSDVKPSSSSSIDAILISNESPDHCHQDTLLGFASEVPVFASPKAAKKIVGWKHFSTVVPTKSFDPATESWQTAHPGSGLPSWITPIDLVGHTAAHFGTAIILTSQSSDEGPGLNELIALIPHGLLPSQPQWQNLTESASPPIRTLAIMHPLKESWTLGVHIYLGISNALALARQSQAPYYVKTADSKLINTGVFSYALSEKPSTIQAGLENEKKAGTDGHQQDLACYEVESGKCLVLA